MNESIERRLEPVLAAATAPSYSERHKVITTEPLRFQGTDLGLRRAHTTESIFSDVAIKFWYLPESGEFRV